MTQIKGQKASIYIVDDKINNKKIDKKILQEWHKQITKKKK